MAKLFGTDGIRGLAGQFPLDPATIKVVGTSLSTELRKQLNKHDPLIVIGRDTRESGPWIEQAFIEGATRDGAICRSAGVITTPGVAFLARTLPADAGVVISASHNPYQDNGIKVFSPSGKKLDDSIERLIEADIENASALEQDAAPQLPSSDLSEAAELRERYLNFLADEIAAGLSLENLTIVIDCANGAASSLAPRLFARLGANVIALNNEPDGRNINLNCGSLHIEGLQQRVLDERADLGIAFDGDADRALFVDNNGQFVDGDATLWALAKYLDDKGKLKQHTVVATVMSNIGLELALKSRGLSLVRKDVGDKYVLEELLRSRTSLGGEQSGHLIFPDLSLAGDGMITALCLLRALVEAGGSSLAQLTEGFVRYPQILVNVRVTEKKDFDELEQVSALAQEIEMKLSGRGRLLLRYSGTERLARVMIEGENQKEIDGYASQLAGAIKAAIGER
ncbi:MAG TPA: phosphoglucosamine mutase [Pyrinomonadaceae bacterium]|nr:phosphoglucosamine mutase [Pyrinomonadaceae bacterium]